MTRIEFQHTHIPWNKIQFGKKADLVSVEGLSKYLKPFIDKHIILIFKGPTN